MDDLISRQAAIDALVQCTNCGDEDTLREYVLKHSLDNGWTGGILEALDAVKDLPTAQPELNLENLVRMIEFGITATNSRDAYSLGMRNGMRWCKSLIDGVEPKYEDGVTRVDDGIYSAELPPAQPEQLERCPIYDGACGYPSDQCYDCPRHHGAQPEPHEGHWIKHETPDGGVQYECSECGVLWEFTDGTPEDNEAYFCPKCGAKMTISTK